MKRLAALAAFCLYGALASAQPYPAKPIRIVVPLAAGTATDTVVRILAAAVSPLLGQPIVVDPKPGANGAIASAEVAKSAPDGYTLLISSSSGLSTTPYLRKDKPYDPVTDFTPITDLGRYTLFFYINASVPAKTFQEFISYAKANPGKLSYATANLSTLVGFMQVINYGGLDMVNVPYKVAPQAVADLVAGRIQAMWETPTTGLPHVRDGKLRPLATSLRTRSPLLPEVPTIYEAGISNYDGLLWMGLHGPAKLPREIVDRINRDFHAAMKKPEVIAALDRQGFSLTPSTPEQLGTLVKEQVEAYSRLLRAAGVQPE